MRVALCLCGQPRFFRYAREVSYPYLYEGRDFDTFCHAWHNPETEGMNYVASSGYDGGPVEVDTARGIVELFQPKKWIILPQMYFNTDGYHVDGNYVNPHIVGNFSWPYAISLVGKILKDYEAEKGFRYDGVVLTRYDLHFHERVPIEELDLSYMWTLDTGVSHIPAFCDQLFISNRDNIEHMFDLYHHMHRYFREIDQFNTERNSCLLMEEKGIPSRLLKLSYHIIRG